MKQKEGSGRKKEEEFAQENPRTDATPESRRSKKKKEQCKPEIPAP